MTSTLHVYQMDCREGFMSVEEKVCEIVFPNMSEDIDVQGNLLYSCFESASNYYHMPLDGGGKSKNAVDRIMVNSVSQLIELGLSLQ